jgi:segregation and condensation protein B
VAVSSNIIQALEEREWIRVVGHRDVPGKPALFGTTKVFLDYFGLRRLDELPPLSELKDIGELEPQLPLDGTGQPAAAIPAAVGNGLTAVTAIAEDAASNTTPDTGETKNSALAGEPEATPGERVADVNENEDNAVATTTVAVDEADQEPKAAAQAAGRSQTNE